MEELLPIGSVVDLKDNRRGMIIGYLPSKPHDEVLYDYVCCKNKLGIRHRWGNIKVGKDIFYIQKKDIAHVLYIGYQNEEFDAFSSYCSAMGKKTKQLDLSKMNHDELDKMYRNVFSEYMKSGSDKNEK